MHKIKLLLIVMLCGILNATAQEMLPNNENDTIKTDILVIKKGCKIANSNDNLLTISEVKNILSAYPDLQNTFNSGIKNMKVANAFSWVGGFCLGFGLGGMFVNVIYGNKIQSYNYYILGSGAVLLVPAFTIEAAGKKKIKSAVNQYNAKQQSNNFDVKLNFGLTSNGIGFKLNF